MTAPRDGTSPDRTPSEKGLTQPPSPFSDRLDREQADGHERCRDRGAPSWIGAAFAFISVFIAAGSPIPLYNEYRTAGEVPAAGLTVAFAAYVTVACLTLLLLGRLSDHLGRRPVALAALDLALVGTALLTTVHGTVVLVAARGLQGLAAGLAASSIGTMIVDLAAQRLRGVATAVAAGGAPFGLAVGAAGGGALVQHAPAPRLLTYLVAAALVLLGPIAVAFSPETRPRTPGALQSIRPRVAVPAGARRLLVPAAAIFASTWALGGFYQASGTSIVQQQLHVADSLVAGTAVSALLAASAIAGVVSGRVAVPRPELTGMALVVVAASGAAIALTAGATAGFLIAAVATGFGWGVAYTGALQHLLSRTGPGERAGVLSVVYILSYGGAAVPGFVVSGFFGSVPLLTIYLGYLAILVVAFVVVATGVARERLDRSPLRP